MWQSQSQYSSPVFTYLHERATEASPNSAWTGPEQADTSPPCFPSIFLQLHYVVIVSCLSPQLLQACLFLVDSAFVKEITKPIQQLLKVSSHKACGENSLSKLWSSVPKHLFGFQGVCSPELRAGGWRTLQSSGTAFLKHLPWWNIEAWA